MEYLNIIKDFYNKLPKFADDRIDYTESSTAPVLDVVIKCKDEILILKRGDRVLHYKQRWNILTGFLDEIRPLKDKVLQELKEELGIESVSNMKIKQHYEISDKEINKTWIIFPILVELNNKPKIELDWEHTEYKWIEPEQIDDYDAVPGVKQTIDLFL